MTGIEQVEALQCSAAGMLAHRAEELRQAADALDGLAVLLAEDLRHAAPEDQAP